MRHRTIPVLRIQAPRWIEMECSYNPKIARTQQASSILHTKALHGRCGRYCSGILSLPMPYRSVCLRERQYVYEIAYTIFITATPLTLLQRTSIVSRICDEALTGSMRPTDDKLILPLLCGQSFRPLHPCVWRAPLFFGPIYGQSSNDTGCRRWC